MQPHGCPECRHGRNTLYPMDAVTGLAEGPIMLKATDRGLVVYTMDPNTDRWRPVDMEELNLSEIAYCTACTTEYVPAEYTPR